MKHDLAVCPIVLAVWVLEELVPAEVQQIATLALLPLDLVGIGRQTLVRQLALSLMTQPHLPCCLLTKWEPDDNLW